MKRTIVIGTAIAPTRWLDSRSDWDPDPRADGRSHLRNARTASIPHTRARPARGDRRGDAVQLSLIGDSVVAMVEIPGGA